MGRRTIHGHAVIGRTVAFHPYTYDGAAPGSGYWSGETVCGVSGGGLSGAPGEDGLAPFVQAHNLKATCPKCAAKWGAAKLAKLGGRVTLEKRDATPEERATRGYKVDSDYQPFRSWWRVLVDGVECASIVNERGYGTLWEVRQLKRDAKAYGWTGRVVGSSVSRSRRSPNDGENEGLWPIHRASRESAAAACLALREAGFLPTVAEMAEAEREAEERRRLREEQRERERTEAREAGERSRAERAERLAEATAALESLAARPDLSNVEAAGIASLRALLGIGEQAR